MIIDCIADLHGYYPELKGGDLLIVAGDLTKTSTWENTREFLQWLYEKNYKKKIFIAGNHDTDFLRRIPFHEYGSNVSYLEDSGTEFEGLKIWGTPWTLTFPGINPHCTAFTSTEEELEAKFAMIPNDIDILISHGPPIAVLDHTIDDKFAGSVSLSAQLGFLENLKLHVFGHIHESYGKIDPPAYLPNYFDVCKHYSVNCSHVNEHYEPVHKPIRVIL